MSCVCGGWIVIPEVEKYIPRTVIVDMQSFRLAQKAQKRRIWGRHIFQISSSHAKSLATMILLTGVVFLGTYLKDEDRIKADNICDVLYTSTKLETV